MFNKFLISKKGGVSFFFLILVLSVAILGWHYFSNIFTESVSGKTFTVELAAVPAGDNVFENGFVAPASCGVVTQVCTGGVQVKGDFTCTSWGNQYTNYPHYPGQCSPPPPPPPPPPPLPQCSNGIDDDGDTLIDYPADPGCVDAADNDETNQLNPNSSQCSNGVDDDGDTLIDYPNDLGCSSLADDSETNPTIILSIMADPTLVRSGGVATINWSTQFVTNCTITGPGINIDSGPIAPYDTFSGSRNITNITEETTITLSCVDFNGNTSSASTRINILPIFEEF